MVFSSVAFLIFFLVVTLLYFVTPTKYRWILLLAASCYFYMYFYPPYLLILIVLILIDYGAAIAIESTSSERMQRFWLIVSLVGNISMLAFFKYFNFINENITQVFALFGWHNSIHALNILLPLGLSFHTFQSMSYTIEVHRGNVKAERHLGIYALYVMFYPQLVAGPIERPNTLLPQLKKNDNKLNYDDVMIGLAQILYGLFKKVVVADTLALYVNSIYNNAYFNSGFTLLFATWMFVFQVYCDFSGYSDMAIGAGRVMGYRMTRNFALPLFSKSLVEFWRRWHISLYSWFSDYVYTPFVINKRYWGKWAVVTGLLFTFFISGLWHGASWNYVIWGVLNGAFIAIETLFLVRTADRSKLSFPKKVFYTFLVFQLYSFTMIFFRSRFSSFERCHD